MLKVAILGVGGRMGRTLVQASQQEAGWQLTAATERPGAPVVGRDAGEVAGIGAIGVTIQADLAGLAERLDVAIDFTSPHASLAHLEVLRAQGTPMVIGTTGFDEAQHARIRQAAEWMPIMLAPNMSVGVNLCLKLIELAARVLDEADIEVIEAHHRHKVDAPSGTAQAMGEVIARTLGLDLKTAAVYARHGLTGERKPNTIGFQSIRAGDIVGEHTVLFAREGERVEIRHIATSRLTFAQGALQAARWVTRQPPGLYDMQDVLGLK